MKTVRWTCGLLLVGFLLLAPGAQAADTPEQLSEKGAALLSKGDFDGALRAFVAATKAEPTSETYRQQATLLQRVIRLRAELDRYEGAAWLARAESLHTYYIEHQVLDEALSLAEQLHTRAPSAASVARRARTQLAAGREAEAAGLLRGLNADQSSPETRALLGLALARLGETAAAQSAIEGLASADEVSGALLFDLACVRARTGDCTESLALLQRSLEQTPPSQLEAMKSRANQSVDLASVRSSGDYPKVLAATSKVPESKCSTGTSCGACPSRTSCGDGDKDKSDPAPPEAKRPPANPEPGATPK
ncbi:MAG: hypothetical protein IPM18_06075 [Phycisphaerales bacterium]|nr:hypothetical protein [Phycisphaerales bacterium]